MTWDSGRKALHLLDALFLGFSAYLFFIGRLDAATVVLVSALLWAFGRTLNDRLSARLPGTWRGDLLYALVFDLEFAVVLTGSHAIFQTLGWSDDGARPLRELASSLAFFLVFLTPLMVWNRRNKRRRHHEESRAPREIEARP